MIVRGWTAEPDWIHSVINKGRPEEDHITLDPKVFNLVLQGARLLVLRDEAEKTYGGLITIPDTVRVKNPPGAGWVVAVGPDVGQRTAGGGYPFGLACDDPRDILGSRVIFGMYTGSEFLTDFREGGYTTKFWVMTDRDIWMIDTGDNSNQENSNEEAA